MAGNKGSPKCGRTALGNGCPFDHRINGHSARGRRLRDLIADYTAAMGREPSNMELDFMRSCAVLHVEIDAMEHAPKLEIAKHRTAINARDMLLRRCGVLAAEWHHPDHITEGAALTLVEEAS